MSLHLWNRISSTRLSFLQPSWVKVKAGNLGSWVTIGRDRARKREEKCWVNRPEAWTNLWVLHCDWKNPFGLKTTGLASRMGQFSSLQLLSHVRLFVTPWITARQASLSITNSQSLPRLMSIESVMPSNHLVLCRPLLLPSIFPSIRVFSNESVLHIRWPKYWSFSFTISPSNEHSGLISFRMECLDLLAVQGTLKSLLQHHSSKASTSVLSFPYSPTLTSIHDYWKKHSFD